LTKRAVLRASAKEKNVKHLHAVVKHSVAGIEINKELISDTERSAMISELKELWLELKTPQGRNAVVCFKQIDELCQGDYIDDLSRPLV
jgi:hypothetical protein